MLFNKIQKKIILKLESNQPIISVSAVGPAPSVFLEMSTLTNIETVELVRHLGLVDKYLKGEEVHSSCVKHLIDFVESKIYAKHNMPEEAEFSLPIYNAIAEKLLLESTLSTDEKKS